MTLTEELEIARINHSKANTKNSTRFNSDYTFIYKKFLCTTLNIGYSLLAYTNNYKIPLTNFGYDISIEKWDNRRKTYGWAGRMNDDCEDGELTAKYIDSKESRKIILKFVYKNIQHYLTNKRPPILVRGAMTPEKEKLKRYWDIDAIILRMGYEKLIFTYEEATNFTDFFSSFRKDSQFWIYVKDDFIKKELLESFQCNLLTKAA